MTSFSASVEGFMQRSIEARRAIMRDAASDTMTDAQLPKAQGGRMPVDTGNLRNSVASGLNGVLGAPDAASISLTIEQMEPGDVAQFAWTAPYAMRQEFGFVGQDSLGRTYDQSGNHFVGGAAAKWPQTVAAAAERHKV